MIYQEYSDGQDTTLDYLAASAFTEYELTTLVEGDEAMAWKRLRPSALCTVCKSLYIGAFISILAATITGALYSLFTYVSYQTEFNCEFHPRESYSGENTMDQNNICADS